jgi:hypothetical protein
MKTKPFYYLYFLIISSFISFHFISLSGDTYAGSNFQMKKATGKASSHFTKKLNKAGVNNKDIDRALDFIISKNMSKKLNAIQWTMKAGTKGRPILSGNHYQLVNMANNRGLKRQKRTIAANLGFLKENSKKFNMLIKRKKGNGQVRYGDIIALNLKPYGWLRYKKQGRGGGINLGDDDNKPHYIWQIRGGRTGTKLLSGMPFALYNLKPIKTEIIFCLRTSGIDLGWRGKSKCGGTLAKASGKVFGANGALSGDGLSGKLAIDWKNNLCKAAVGAAATYATAQTGSSGAAAVAAAAPKAIKKCNAL